MRVKIQIISIIITILFLIGCKIEKDNNMNKKEQLKTEKEECLLSVEDQKKALKEFYVFRKELLSKAEKAKNLQELKEFFVDSDPLNCKTWGGVREVTIEDLILVLKNPNWFSSDYVFEESVSCMAFSKTINANTKVDGEDGYLIDLSFIYNGIKKRWEISVFEIIPKP